VELQFNDGLRVEEVDGEAIVLDRNGAVAHRVTGAGLEALRLARAGIDDDEIPEHLTRPMDELVEAGIVRVDRARWTRRKLLVAGGTAWTVTTIALASPAAAATGCAQGPSDALPWERSTAGSYTFRPGPGVTSVRIHAWGGGGSGGRRMNANMESAGGGGGAYASSVVTVTPCQAYTVVVGAGGLEPAQGSDGLGNSGTASTFAATTVVAAGGTAGNSVTGGAGGTVAASTGTIRAAGGAGSNTGGMNVGGGGGGAGGATAGVAATGGTGTTAAAGTGGGTAPTKGGDGGTPDNTASGRAGKSPGGGAAGADTTYPVTGANGADGLVRIETP
jgi:hypothetical protein